MKYASGRIEHLERLHTSLQSPFSVCHTGMIYGVLTAPATFPTPVSLLFEILTTVCAEGFAQFFRGLVLFARSGIFAEVGWI